jgi:hypothetical protein
MIVIHLVEENLLFVPDLLHTKGASFPRDPTLPYLRPSTLINFFTELEKIAEKIIFWDLIQTTAVEAEEDGIINLDNFIDLKKIDLQPYQQYENYNSEDLINIIRRYTSFQNMGR